MSNIIIGIIGIVSIILFLFLSGRYGFSFQEQTIASILLLISTLLVNVLTSIFLLHKKIKLIHPTLSLPTEEQKDGYELMLFLNQLQKNGNNASSILAMDQFNHAKHALSFASGNADFRVNDIAETNKTLLGVLNAGDTFDGVSMLVDPDIWRHNKGYLDINIRKANEGVKIRRIFVYDNREKFKSMTGVMDRLVKARTEVFWCMKDDLDFREFCQDFTIVKEHKVGVYIPVQKVNPTVIVSNSDDQINNLQSQFSKLLSFALKYEPKTT